jgi:YhgE/Pip-like protein
MKMLRAALDRPYGWILLAVAIIMALAMTASYLGAFLDPEGHAHNMPLAIVNEDAGLIVSGQTVNKGADVAKAVTAPNPQLGDTVKWTVLPSRVALVDRMRDNDFYAGIVIPKDLSQNLAELTAPGRALPQAATIETLSNPASGTFASSQSDTITAAAVDRVNDQTREQFFAAATRAGQPVPAAAAPVIANPVRNQPTTVVDLGTHNGHGLAPLYFAVVLTLGGFIGADIVSLGTDFLTGEGTLGGAIAKIRGAPYTSAGPLTVWAAKMVLTIFLLTAFGTVGLLFGVLFTTILGVPSSGGVFPLTMVPDFY